MWIGFLANLAGPQLKVHKLVAIRRFVVIVRQIAGAVLRRLAEEVLDDWPMKVRSDAGGNPGEAVLVSSSLSGKEMTGSP
jgi:hypothetical protein